jgi:capsular polysaccharide transport system permease protein
MDRQGARDNPFFEPVVRQGRVLLAIMLRDIRTRFFGHGLGFLVAIAWPLAHILILLAIYDIAGRAPPYGDSAALFFATGLAPFMAFSYMSRFVMYSVVMNRPLLAFPAVRITDILFARILLEALGACCMAMVLAGLLALGGVDVVPRDPVDAALAFGAALLLGAGYGVVNGIVAMAVHTWATVYALLIILMYVLSGVLFVPDALPEQLRTLLMINPAVHLVEWMRSAYYEGYGTLVLNKPYLMFCALSSLFGGLLAERVFRGPLLASK